MEVALDTTGTMAGFKETLCQFLQNHEPESILVLSCADNNFLPREQDSFDQEIDNSLRFMMSVLEGEFVDIMHSNEDSMLQSAASALRSSLEMYRSENPPKTSEELEAISSAGVSLVGSHTCGGEIGTSGSDFLEYYSRTCAVGVFGE